MRSVRLLRLPEKSPMISPARSGYFWRSAALSRANRPSLRRVINGTGVVLHTNLGRAPLAAAALQAAVRGNNVVARELVGSLARLVGGSAPEPAVARPPAPFTELTPREREILECIADGMSNKMIARALEITDGTVKLHVKAILRKLGMRSRVEAAVAAVEHGLGRKRQGSAPRS